ncbi:hypothetical protein [Pseudomonas brassicae]|nr:hypothetical protein [Pseudomonas brassicae]
MAHIWVFEYMIIRIYGKADINLMQRKVWRGICWGPATLKPQARSPDMADKYVGKIVGVGTDNLEYVINIYQDEIVERSSGGMVRHEGIKHFEVRSGGAVKRISETEYEIVATGVRVTVRDGES